MPQDYNQTLNLPKTDFPMRGNLPKREPETLAHWEEENLYQKMVARNEGKPKYVLHDGPPYANGEIHLGTALNKVLKDFIVKYKNMSGFCAPYVPGWDTHGLPIELKAMKAIGVENGAIEPVELRKHCADYAMKHVHNQMAQFKRLGSLGDYDHPYLTLRPEYEARQVKVFGKMAKDGYMYKGLKPVYWCPDCNTALAEAEIEYENDPCKSIYVKFRVTDDKGVFAAAGITGDIYFVIWTTTTWTIPGNLAICVGPEYTYTLVHANNEYYVMAQELVAETMKAAGIAEYETIGAFKGSELEYMQTKHPLYDRNSMVIVGDHVTLESGTGCVHTAPGYGVEDFEVCKNYDEIGILVCVDDKGRQTAEAGEFAGLDTAEANKAIAARLVETGAMFASADIVHQYPHCWRCHSAIIYRATEQWFCSVNGFKDEAIKAIESVNWIPAWGEERIKGMVRDRSDWCISRQRTWGVPIPVIYCKDCGKPIITDETIEAISELFRKEGSDAWYTRPLSDFIPASVACACGCKEFEKEHDIMDVWFDSGVSHTAVLDEYDELYAPCDLYLEGADQYRGWFQSSLLTSVATQGVAPYREVLCHGWVVDAQGKQMHKSAGNGMEPSEIIRDYGADIIRLWVASSDYTVDVRAGKEIFRQLSEAYRKMRNTARFMLGNISDFDPAKDMVDNDQLFEIDRWALEACNKLTATMRDAYEHYDFSRAYHALYNFCVIDMSNFYMDVIKDRLYCADDHARRCAQTALYRILIDFTKLLAPILCFTSQEIWSYIPKLDGMKDYVVFEQMPEAKAAADEAFEAKWDRIMAIRDDVKKVLEQARADKVIGSALEAGLTLYCSKEVYDFLNAIPMDELADLFIVSHVDLVEGEGGVKGLVEGLGVSAAHAAGNKCLRCWKYETTVGEDGLCPRCAKVLKQ